MTTIWTSSNQINIPAITIDTPIPYSLNLREEGQPLQGLKGKFTWASSHITTVHIRPFNRSTYPYHQRIMSEHASETTHITVRTVGLAAQTARERTFKASDRAAMVAYVNEWIAKTVASGLKRIAEQQAEKDEVIRHRRAVIKEQIERAGGVEARRLAILEEGRNIVARETLSSEVSEFFGAVMTAIINNTPIALDDAARARLVAKFEDYSAKERAWEAKAHIENAMEALETYLAEAQKEGEG